MEMERKFAFDVGWALVSSIITLVIAFLLRIVLARWLGAADLGLYTVVVTIHGFATLVATLGIPSALTKYVAEYKDDRNRLFQTTFAAFVSSIIFGLMVGALIFALSGILAGVFHMPELARLLKILAVVFPFTCILQTMVGLFNGLRQMRSYAYLEISRSLLMILSIVSLVWFGFGVEGAITGIIISFIGGCIFGLYLSRSFLHLNLQNLIQNVKKIVLFGSQITGVNALNLVTIQADIILIGYFMASKDVGYYSVAVGLGSFFLLIPQAFQRITYPATSEYWAQKNYRALIIMINKSMKYSACIVLPLGLGVGFFAEGIITILFGQEFIYAALPLWILLIARVIAGSTSSPVGGSITGAGRPDIALKLNALSCGINIVLNILLIPRYGITGAAIATAISLLAQAAIYLILMPRILMARIDIKWYARVMGFSCIAIALFLIGIKFINPYIVGGIILCGFIILVFRVFLTKEDRTTFGSLARSLMSRR